MTNPWIQHVQAFRKQHPQLSYKECLKQAKTTYKSQSGKGKEGNLASFLQGHPNAIKKWRDQQRPKTQSGGFGLIDLIIPKTPTSHLIDKMREKQGLPPLYDPRTGLLRAGMVGMDVISGGVTKPGTTVVNTLL